MKKTMLAMSTSMAIVSAFTVGAIETEQLKSLGTALQDGGVTGLLAITKDVPIPKIPSKWHIETHIKDEEKIKEANAARDFGLALVVQLETVAQQFQEMPPDKGLCDWAYRLLDLADWCASADGIGNLIIAQRCLDIAGVGLGRVTANLDFPLDECKRLASRMSLPPDWLKEEMKRRCRILDTEAGTNLFASCKTQEDMQRVWLAGLRLSKREMLLQAKAEGMDLPDSIFRKDDILPESVLRAAESFFENEAPLFDPNTTPYTWRTCWDMRNHRYLLGDFWILQSIQKARALLRFREEVGYFPERPQLTQDETKEIIEEAKRRGRTITKPEDDLYSDPQRKAFSHAWQTRPNKKKEDQNPYSTAFQAYKEITSGTFYDRDTASIREIERRKKPQQETEQKPPAALTPEEQERLKTIWQEIERQK